MRLAASTVFIIGIVLANQVHAKDFSIQPLTRIDCNKAEMAWDENANVCIADAVSARQPLTRPGCEMAGMAWNDDANVCSAAPLAAEALPDPDGMKARSKSRTTDTSREPFTRSDCDKAGMSGTIVRMCAVKSRELRPHRRRQARLPPASSSTSTRPNSR